MKIINFLAALFAATTVRAGVLTPQTTAEFKSTSVRIYNTKMNSGGTGSILNSSKTGSEILTNKHVCRLIEPGGYVSTGGKKYPVDSYKKFSDHDLCLVRVKANLKVSTKISGTMAKASDTVYVSGHPNLLPHIVTKGHLSDNVEVRLIVGVTPCDESDMKKNGIYCLFFGGLPVIKVFDSQVVSNLIKPGSSGSAVFNDKGEIVGVVFAGSGRNFSHGYIVPQKYILYFMAMAKYHKYVKVGTPVDDEGLSGRIFNYKTCSKKAKSKVKRLCNRTKSNMIWRKND